MKTVLFAWELGRGSGHIAKIRRYAAVLSRHGVRLVAAVREPALASSLAASGIELVQAPNWAFESFTPEQSATVSSATMGDGLATIGLADPEALASLLAGWQHILKDVDPDLVVADYAPAASLLARHRIPLLLTGNGYTLPPSEMTHFPLLHRLRPPVWEEASLLTILNQTGRAFHMQPLARLPEIFSGDAVHVETLPLLDPYHLQRLVPVDGPVIDKSLRARKQNAEEILVYLSNGVPIRPDIISALLPFSSRIRIYGPGISVSQQAEFARLSAQLHSEPIDLSEALESACLVVHLGGSGLSAHAIAAGVPQLVFSVHMEQELTGLALEREGIGRLIRSYDPAVAITPEVVSDIIDDSALAQRAMQSGELQRKILRHFNPLAAFEAKSRSLLRI